MRRSTVLGAGSAIAIAVLAAQLPGGARQPAARAGDWPMYRHDLVGSGYSPLAQFDASNVSRLSRVWTYKLQPDLAGAPLAGGGAAAARPSSARKPHPS